MLERVLEENAGAQARRLDFFLHLLDRFFEIIPAHSEETVAYTLLLASILRIRQSAGAAQLLAQAGCIEEIQVLGRSLVESTVNAVYLQHAGEREVQRYLRFHPESLHGRNALMHGGRTSPVGSMLARVERLFLGNSTQREPDWTRLTLLDRAAFCDQVSEAPVMVALVERCYPRGHAALHGTIGGLDSFLHSLSIGRPLEREDRLADLADALFAINLCLLTLAVYLNHAFGLGMDEAIDQAANADSTSVPSLEGNWNVA